MRPDFANHYRYIEAVAIRVAMLESELRAQHDNQRRITTATLIQQYFSLEELEELIFELGADPAEIEGETITTRPFHLVAHCTRHGLTDRLRALLQEKRPFLDW